MAEEAYPVPSDSWGHFTGSKTVRQWAVRKWVLISTYAGERNLRKAWKAKGSWTWWWGHYQGCKLLWESGGDGSNCLSKGLGERERDEVTREANWKWVREHLTIDRLYPNRGQQKMDLWPPGKNTNLLRTPRWWDLLCNHYNFISFVANMTWKACCDPSWAYFSSRSFIFFSPVHKVSISSKASCFFFFPVPICCYFGEPITPPSYTRLYIPHKSLPCIQGWV